MKKDRSKKSVAVLGMIALVFIAIIVVLLVNNYQKNLEMSDETVVTTTEDTTIGTQELNVEDKIEPTESDEPDNNQGEIKEAQGIYDGFIDGHSIEIQLDSGEYQSYLVYDEDLIEELSKLEDFEHISFTYQESVEDGRLPQVISIND